MKPLFRLMYKISLRIADMTGARRISIFDKALKMFRLLAKSNITVAQGHKMYLDDRDILDISIYRVHEPKETKLVKSEINRGDVVLDIGANIGYFTLIFARLVGPEGRVYAFEPDPTFFTLLKKNVEINGYKNVTLIQSAVSDKTEDVLLFLVTEWGPAHNLFSSYQGVSKSVTVKAITLDDYFLNDGGRVDFIKMDIEGAELKAVRGMRNLLARSKKLKMLMEFSPPIIRRSGGVPGEGWLKILTQEYNFEFMDPSAPQGWMSASDIPKLLENYSNSVEPGTNLLLSNYRMSCEQELKKAT